MIQLKEHYTRILETGAEKPNRKGEFDTPNSTLSVFGAQLRFDLSDWKLPVATAKKMFTGSMFKELAWMLRGETNIKTLGCGIWDKWCLIDDVVISAPLPEYSLIEQLIELKLVETISEGSNYLFDIARKHITIPEGTTRKEVNENDEEVEVVITNENITIEDMASGINDFNPHTFAEECKTLGLETMSRDVAMEKGYCGPIYGAQWRAFQSTVKDVTGQIQTVSVDQLLNVWDTLKNDVYSRRNIVSAWNPGLVPESGVEMMVNIANGKMGLPPCHKGFQMYVAGRPDALKLSIALELRSSDSGLGLPFNIGSYAAIGYLYAAEFDIEPQDLVVNIGDAHIYKAHIDGIKQYIDSPVHDLPDFKQFKENYEEIRTRIITREAKRAAAGFGIEDEEQIDLILAAVLRDRREGFRHLLDGIEGSYFNDCLGEFTQGEHIPFEAFE